MTKPKSGKKIEKLEPWRQLKPWLKKMPNPFPGELADVFVKELIVDKINEIIDRLNKDD